MLSMRVLGLLSPLRGSVVIGRRFPRADALGYCSYAAYGGSAPTALCLLPTDSPSPRPLELARPLGPALDEREDVEAERDGEHAHQRQHRQLVGARRERRARDHLRALADADELAAGGERVGRGAHDRERLEPARQNLDGVVDARDEEQNALEDVRRLGPA